MVAICPLLLARCATYVHRVVWSTGRSIALTSLSWRARPNPRPWPFTLSSCRHEEVTTISIPRHHLFSLILSCSASLEPLPPDYAATFFQYLATVVCSCAVVALALGTVIERPVGPLVPDAFQRRELVDTGARGLLCFAATQALAFAIVAGIKEEREKLILQVVSGPPIEENTHSVPPPQTLWYCSTMLRTARPR